MRFGVRGWNAEDRVRYKHFMFAWKQEANDKVKIVVVSVANISSLLPNWPKFPAHHL